MIKEGTNLPSDFDPEKSTFRVTFDVDSLAINPVTGVEVGPDGGFFTVTPDDDVQRFDYNNQSRTGYWELASNGVTDTESAITFYHATSSVPTSPNGDATPITITVTFDPATQVASQLVVNFTLPDYSTDNPGGTKAGATVYSYTLVKDGTL